MPQAPLPRWLGRRPSLRLSPDGSPERKWRSTRGLWALIRHRPYYFVLALLAIAYTIVALHQRYISAERIWIPPFTVLGPVTLVFSERDLQRVWRWEIAAGHYPSAEPVPAYVGPAEPNPARPRPSHSDASAAEGQARVYVTPEAPRASVAYPPRPIPGSAADLDIIMQHCDFSGGKYVRDCLKTLRSGAELDAASRHVRGGTAQDFKYIYVTDFAEGAGHARAVHNETTQTTQILNHNISTHHDDRRSRPNILALPPLPTVDTHGICHGVDRRVFHLFWTGTFTDKPYMALLSFLYTQNLGLHLPRGSLPPTCKTEMWFWITQPEWARFNRATWEKRMYDELKTSEWAVPFLHPRFSEVIKFKIWDAEEQLDAIDELKDEWRRHKHVVFKSPRATDDTEDAPGPVEGAANTTTLAARAPSPGGGSQSADAYDRPSVALSDLVRFVLLHRYGGVYLDVDTVLLRDWETLWGAPRAWAYRWSRLDRYNTAALRLHARSALGAWLLRTALADGLDFHPTRVSRYVRDARMDRLLLCLPDALFDPAWLMVEGFHAERPPQPLLHTFNDFFETPALLGASPEALGFDGFFKGAYSYHYHNNWWTPFDPARNYPDLGPRFATNLSTKDHPPEAMHELSWSAVMKRTFEAYIQGDQPNMYGEWLEW
ncbi:hypothetical protein PsYK624_018070 [Phanerochaete sordida]|uniref:Glycosyltransferase family 32 protein n=1 Tax=Phanerochaete sordida TaxID=48140 RepID=A0A9P3FYS7_9APHY|nr:hypothetical protein PsYK624_018070 [Phanerochaete sordida]